MKRACFAVISMILLATVLSWVSGSWSVVPKPAVNASAGALFAQDQLAASPSSSVLYIETYAEGGEVVIFPDPAEGWASDMLKWHVNFNVIAVLPFASHVRITVGVDSTSGKNPWGSPASRESPMIAANGMFGWHWEPLEPTNTKGLFPHTVSIYYEVDPGIFIKIWEGNGTIMLEKVITVPDDYPTIQEAINNADEGDTILVKKGTYYENVVVNNTVTLLGEDRDSTVLNGTTIEPQMVVEADGVTIRGFTFVGWAFQNIAINASNNVVVVGNKIVFSALGVDVENSVNATIENNIIDGFGLDNTGVMLASSSECSVVNNTITNAIYNGIRLWFSNNNTIHQNLIEDNDYGMFLHEADLNTITENTIAESGGPGIYIDLSSSNTIYHNSFIDNYQAVNCGGSGNTLDDGYPSGGNYWSDYNGTDSDGDGIGDSPYVVSPSNQDNYPLMDPWAHPDFAVTNVEPSQTVVAQRITVGTSFFTTIDVTAENQGNKIEGCNLTLYANSTAVGTRYFTLIGGNSTVLTFAWNTTSFAKGDYIISAVLDPLAEELDISDNVLVDGTVYLGVCGDVDGNHKVNMLDLYLIAVNFGTPAPYDTPEIANCDIDHNNIIAMLDMYIAALNYGQTDP